MDQRTVARIRRIQSEPYPQFGHEGTHRGNGAPDCPRERHHHHDWFCERPSRWEWEAAGRNDLTQWRSRA